MTSSLYRFLCDVSACASRSSRLAISATRCLGALALSLLPLVLWAEPQDPPDFKGKHDLPEVTRPAPRAWEMGIVDIALLFLALTLATWMIHKSRSRKGLFWLSIFSLGYFGFAREGCVCAIGSIQNVSQAIFDVNFVAPLVVVMYFFVPLLYAALFGRSYCAAVCPHGAIQDLVVVKPLEVPRWLEHVLGILPFVYLGLAVLFAATGTAYIICDYDPFIPIFRLTGSPAHFALGALFLIAGMFIGRPYCRYMCPYGVLLRMGSHVAKWNVKIYPDRCIDCTLCDDSCPFGCIDKTTPLNQNVHPKEGKTRLTVALLATPLLIAGLAWFSTLVSAPIAQSHEKVRVAYRMEKELVAMDLLIKNGDKMDEWRTTDDYQRLLRDGLLRPEGNLTKLQIEEETEWLYDDGVPPEKVFAEAQEIKDDIRTGTWWFGAWIGLILSIKFISLSIRRKRLEYVANEGSCYACGRCYDYCPGSNGVPVQFETGGRVRPNA